MISTAIEYVSDENMKTDIATIISWMAQVLCCGASLADIREIFFWQFSGSTAEEDFYLAYSGAVLLAGDLK